jgi:broad specificity phosphatase PhoE
MTELVLVRHGQTEWSLDGRHTGTTDLPLLEEGRRDAEALRAPLGRRSFALVLSSPLSRARETAELAGLGDRLELDDDLREWNYGEYEGITTPQIRERRPDWDLWRDGCPGGESAADVAARADRVLARAAGAEGDVILVAHGHLLRVVAARWLGLGPEGGALLTLSPATLSVLGFERETHVVRSWNCPVTRY